MKTLGIIILLFAVNSFGAVQKPDRSELGTPQNFITNGGIERGISGFSTYNNTAQSSPVCGATSTVINLSSFGPGANSVSGPTSSVTCVTTGQTITGTGFQAGTTVLSSSVSGTTVTINLSKPTATSGSGAAALSFSNPSHLTISSTSPLAENASLLITNSGSTSAQGEGVAYDFSIDSGYQSSLHTISFLYQLNSGTFVPGTNQPGSTPTTGDLDVWIYDKTNSQLIQPASNILACSSTTTTCQFTGVFQAASNSTSYRLIFHVAGTNTAAWSLKADNISVSPVVRQQTPISVDMQSYSLTISGVTTNPTFGTITKNEARYGRVGDKAVITFDFQTTGVGTSGSGTYLFSLPAGLSVDLTKMSAETDSAMGTAGDAVIHNNTASRPGKVQVYDATHLAVSIYNPPTSDFMQLFSSSYFGFGQTAIGVSFTASIPIQGWGSQSITSDLSTEGRTLSAKYYKSTGTTVTVNTQINFDTKIIDKFGAVITGSGWEFTAPSPGTYQVEVGIVSTAASGSPSYYVYKNGVSDTYLCANTLANQIISGSTLEELNTGDTIDVRPNATAAISGGTAPYVTSISIYRLNGSTTITPAETVRARYMGTPTGTIASTFAGAGSLTFPTPDGNTHGTAFWDGTTIKPAVQGNYCFEGDIQVNATYSAGNASCIELTKNGSQYAEYCTYSGASMGSIVSKIEDCITLLSGDAVTFRMLSTGASPSFAGGTISNHIAVFRQGN